MDSTLEQHRDRFAANPDSLADFEVLEEHFFMEAAWESLADLYRRRIAAPSLAERPKQRAQLGLRLGQLLEEHLADLDSAIEALTDAVRLDSELHAALQHLRRLYSSKQSWETVLQIAELEIAGVTEPEARARLYAEMGDIWLRELDDGAQADQFYERARQEASGTDPEAPGDEDEPLVQRAWIAAARGDSDAALTSLREALERDPTDTEALDMMLTVLEGAERHAEMDALLERRASLATDPETRAAVLMRLGNVREYHLGDLGEARDAYERARAAAPNHSGVRIALVRLYRLTEAWNPLRSLLHTALETAEEGPQRVDLHVEIGSLLDRQFADPEAARAQFERALGLAPEDGRAIDALNRLTATDEEEAPEPPQEQRAGRVVAVLERKLEALESQGEGVGPDAVQLRLRIAEIQSDSLQDPAKAVAVLEPAVDGEGLSQVAPALVDLYARLGRSEGVSVLAERAGAAAEDPRERVEWFRRAAETARDRGDGDRAIACYQKLLNERAHDRGASAALRELHRAREEHVPLVERLRTELAYVDESEEAPLHRELASLLSGSLDDAAGSIAHLRRWLELETQPGEVLDDALRIADGAGGTFAQLDLLDHMAGRARSDAARAIAFARRGSLLADRLEWSEEADDSWQAALAIDPDQPEALSRLSASE